MANVWKLAIRANAAQAKREIKSLGGGMSKIGGPAKVMAAAFVAAGAAVAYATKETINYGDWLEKTAQKTGLTVEALSQYRLGAELAGTSQEALVSSLQRLQKNMGSALRSPTSAAAVAFKNLGIEFKDAQGNLRDLDTLLPEIAQSFSVMKDGTLKTGIAMDLMGRQGAELIPFLNAGATGLEAMRQESDALGQTWSQESAEAAAEFNDEVTRLKATMSGMFNQMVQSWLPTLADLVGGINLMMRSMAGADEASEGFSNSATGYVNQVSKQISDTEDRITHLKFTLSEMSEWSERKRKKKAAEIAETEEQLRRAERNLVTYESGLMQARQAYRDAKAAGLETIELIADATQKEADLAAAGIESAQALEKQILRLSASFDSADVAARKAYAANIALIEQYMAYTGDLETGYDLIAKVSEAHNKELERLAKAGRRRSRTRRKDRNAELKRTIKNIDEEIQAHKDAQRTELEALEDKITAMEQANQSMLDKKLQSEQEAVARLTEIWKIEADEKVRIKAEEAERLNSIREAEKAKAAEDAAYRAEVLKTYREDTQQAYIDVIDSIGSTAGAIGSIITSLAEEGNEEAAKAAKVMFGVQQAASLAVAIIKMAEAVAVANAAGPAPFNIPSIVSAVAVGSAQIATITAATISGLAHAGLPPGAIAATGANEATMLVRRDEMLLDPVGTSVISKMLSDRASGGQPVQVNTTLEIDGDVLGRTVDSHLIRSQERGLGYENRVRY